MRKKKVLQEQCQCIYSFAAIGVKSVYRKLHVIYRSKNQQAYLSRTLVLDCSSSDIESYRNSDTLVVACSRVL